MAEHGPHFAIEHPDGRLSDAELWRDVLGEDFPAELLAKRRTLAAVSAAPLTPEDIADAKSRLDPAWQVLPEGLVRMFEFPDRRVCASFIADLMRDANAHNHHPDIETLPNCVVVTFTTHAAGDKITALDVQSAERADQLAMKFETPEIPDESDLGNKSLTDGNFYGMKQTVLGGPGSGNYGHSGRPGEVGGSGPGGEGANLAQGSRITDRKLNAEAEKTVLGKEGRLKAMAFHVAKKLGQPVDIYLRSGLTDEGGTQLSMVIIGQKKNPNDPNDYLQIANDYHLNDTGELEVHHDYIKLPSEEQGTGLGKRILETELNDYEKLGVEKVRLLANIDVGGYAWAKFGYVLDTEDEYNKPEMFKFRLESHMEEKGASDAVKERVRKILQDHTQPDGTLHPRVVWALADMKDGDRKLGADVLMNFDWQAVLDLHDKESMDRARKYIGQRR